jgi:excisionase family DNA binding protein
MPIKQSRNSIEKYTIFSDETPRKRVPMNEKNDHTSIVTNIMDVHDVAGYLRLSEAAVYKLARKGCLPALRVGKLWRFRKDLIDDWILKETIAGKPFPG